MFAAALIVFREVVEAALIISIIMAATKGVRHRGYWISAGIVGGAICATLIAALVETISSLFQGAGQEIVNAIILSAAVLLIGWHVVWMNSHGRALAAEMRAVGRSISDGEKHMSVLALVVGLAVLREGSEVVLMLQGLWATGSANTTIGGGVLGLAAGCLVGAIIYSGFVILPIARMFTLTNGLLVLIAAGMAARAGNFLAQAGLISSLGGRLWDTSDIFSDQSILGQILSALVGYIARPNGIEVLFYGLTVAVIASLLLMTRQKSFQIVTAIVVMLGLSFGAARLAHAGEVVSPYVTQGEVELENQGYIAHDHNSANNGEQTHVAAIGYSPTDFWKTEIESEFTRAAGSDQPTRYTSLNWENTFQLTEPGEYWLDTGLFYEMDFARDAQTANNVIFGLLAAKTIERFAETFNLLMHKDYGPNNSAMSFIYSNRAKYRLREWLEPGFEIYGDTDGKPRFQDQQLAIGPGLFGKIHTFGGQTLKYQVAYLFGATKNSPDSAARWKLEYEFAF